jgi:hypothetical protein
MKKDKKNQTTAEKQAGQILIACNMYGFFCFACRREL